jgi:hypothetical protein
LVVSVNSGSLMGQRDRRAEKVRKLLWNFLAADVNASQAFEEHLSALLDGTLALDYFAYWFTGGQMNALRNVIHL